MSWGGIRVGERIKKDMLYILQTLIIAEELITETKTLIRIKTSKKIIEMYIEGKGRNE